MVYLSPSVTAVAEFRSWPLTLTETPSADRRCEETLLLSKEL